MKSDIEQLFWDASIEELQRGYVVDEERDVFICLVCGEERIKGVIYRADEQLLEAEKAMQWHLQSEHGSMFEYLLSLDKRYTGLTEHQQKLLRLFYEGLTDKEIVEHLGGGSPSTIRNHRFRLREKEKQAKVFLAIIGLLENKAFTSIREFVTVHRRATMIDERYIVTQDERDKIVKRYFRDGLDGKLSAWPKKEKRKLIVLQHIVSRFNPHKKYTEQEVNEILKGVHDDYVTIRRYLIEYGFLDRTDDCREYWVKR